MLSLASLTNVTYYLLSVEEYNTQIYKDTLKKLIYGFSLLE